MGVAEAVIALAAIASTATAVHSATQKPKAPSIAPTAPPVEVPPDQPISQLGPLGTSDLPQFLASSGISSKSDPLQRRSAIATYGSQTGQGKYLDPSTVRYWWSQTLPQLQSGQDFLPVELNYMERLGVTPRERTTQGWANALQRFLDQ